MYIEVPRISSLILFLFSFWMEIINNFGLNIFQTGVMGHCVGNCYRQSLTFKIKKKKLSFFFKVTQSCLTLCDPMDYTVHGILQARILEWVAFSLSGRSSQPRD